MGRPDLNPPGCPATHPAGDGNAAVSMDQGRMRQVSLSPEVPLERRRTDRDQHRRTGRARQHTCQLTQSRNRWRPRTVGSRQIACRNPHVFVSCDNMRECHCPRRRINGAAVLECGRFEKRTGSIQMRAGLNLCRGLRRSSQLPACDAKLTTAFCRLDPQALLRQSGKSGGIGETVLTFDGSSGCHTDTQQKNQEGWGKPNRSHASDESRNHHSCQGNARMRAGQPPICRE